MISDEQVAFIAGQISESGVEDEGLRADLLDHMCCLVESDMGRGLTFKEAYERAYLQTSPNGYEEIQHETFFLLNYHKIMNMKRATYISGFLFSLILTSGALFKILYWPGASFQLGVGMMGFTFIFLPLLLVNRFKSQVRGVLSERSSGYWE